MRPCPACGDPMPEPEGTCDGCAIRGRVEADRDAKTAEAYLRLGGSALWTGIEATGGTGLPAPGRAYVSVEMRLTLRAWVLGRQLHRSARR